MEVRKTEVRKTEVRKSRSGLEVRKTEVRKSSHYSHGSPEVQKWVGSPEVQKSGSPVITMSIMPADIGDIGVRTILHARRSE